MLQKVPHGDIEPRSSRSATHIRHMRAPKRPEPASDSEDRKTCDVKLESVVGGQQTSAAKRFHALLRRQHVEV